MSTNGRLDWSRLDAAKEEKRRIIAGLWNVAKWPEGQPREQPAEVGNFFRGLVFGLAISSALWAILGFLVWWLGWLNFGMLALLLVGCAVIWAALVEMERTK